MEESLRVPEGPAMQASTVTLVRLSGTSKTRKSDNISMTFCCPTGQVNFSSLITSNTILILQNSQNRNVNCNACL